MTGAFWGVFLGVLFVSITTETIKKNAKEKQKKEEYSKKMEELSNKLNAKVDIIKKNDNPKEMTGQTEEKKPKRKKKKND